MRSRGLERLCAGFVDCRDDDGESGADDGRDDRGDGKDKEYNNAV